MTSVAARGRRQNRRGEGDLLRADIVAAARRLLERDGTEAAVTLRGVAREAGITAPAIYAHFDDRQQVVEAVVAEVAKEASRWLDEALAAMPATASATELLRAFCEAYVSFASERPAGYQVLFVRPQPSEMPLVRAMTTRWMHDFEALLAEALPGADAAEISVRSTLAWCALHGLAVLPPSHPRYPWPATAVLVDELLAHHLADPVAGTGPAVRPARD